MYTDRQSSRRAGRELLGQNFRRRLNDRKADQLPVLDRQGRREDGPSVSRKDRSSSRFNLMPCVTLNRTSRIYCSGSSGMTKNYRRATNEAEPLAIEIGTFSLRKLWLQIGSKIGVLNCVHFEESASGSSNTILWNGILGTGEKLNGEVAISAVLDGKDLVIQAEVTVLPMAALGHGLSRTSDQNSFTRARTPEARLEAITRMANDLISQLRQKPRVATPNVIAALVAIIDAAESEAPKRTAARVAKRFVQEVPAFLR